MPTGDPYCPVHGSCLCSCQKWIPHGFSVPTKYFCSLLGCPGHPNAVDYCGQIVTTLIETLPLPQLKLLEEEMVELWRLRKIVEECHAFLEKALDMPTSDNHENIPKYLKYFHKDLECHVEDNEALRVRNMELSHRYSLLKRDYALLEEEAAPTWQKAMRWAFKKLWKDPE